MAEIILHPCLRHRSMGSNGGFHAELATRLSESVANLEAALPYLARSPTEGERSRWHGDLVSRLVRLIDAGRAFRERDMPELEEIERHLHALKRLNTDLLRFVEACRRDRSWR